MTYYQRSDNSKARRTRVANWMEVPHSEQVRDYLLSEDRDSSDFIFSMYRQMQDWGGLSEKQTAAVWKSMAREKAWAAQREAETKTLLDAGVRVPDEDTRIRVEGKVLSVKWKENGYGGGLKMLVEHADGWKVYGSVPSGIDPFKGDVVAFMAKVKPSEEWGDKPADPTFGFFSRPTKAEIVSTEDREEPAV